MNCETWVGAGFGEVLIDSMRREDPEDVVRTNACNHWLPATVRLVRRVQDKYFYLKQDFPSGFSMSHQPVDNNSLKMHVQS